MSNADTAIFERDGDWIIAYCPEIPGANGQGRTRAEARDSLAAAIALILQDRREDARVPGRREGRQRRRTRSQFYNPTGVEYDALTMAHQDPVTSHEYAFTAVFDPAEEGGYVVTFPAIPNLATEGGSLEEARAMAADCLRGYLETLQELGRPLPESEDRTTLKSIRDIVRVQLKTV